MKKLFVISLLCLVTAAAWAQTDTDRRAVTYPVIEPYSPPWLLQYVTVTNFPAVQTVAGTVSVGNFPATQTVTGSVEVSNLPVVQDVAGTVEVSNLPAVQPVSGTVDVGNLPAVQQVEVTNCPAVESRYQLVGFTAATFWGAPGLFGFHQACGAEFQGSRFCTIEEAFKTTTIPAGLSGSAWIHPGSWPGNDCNGWGSHSDTHDGMAINEIGRFSNISCNTWISIACCAPGGVVN